MQSCSEFAVNNGVDKELSPEMSEFALFSLNMGKVVDEQTKQLAYPHLLGKGVNLWDVLPKSQFDMETTKTQQAEQERIEQEAKRLANLELYAQRGWAFECPE